MKECSDYEIIVAGGGLAGVAAAVSASRNGAKVLLVEKNGFLGGMACSALVNPFMAYWEQTALYINNYEKPLCAGIFKEIIDSLKDFGALYEDDRSSIHKYMIFHEEYLKIILDRLCISSGVDVLFHSQLTDVCYEENRIENIVVSNKSGNTIYIADVFIDATGDADIIGFAGIKCNVGRESDGLSQPMTLCFRLINVDWQKWNTNTRDIADKLYKKLKEEGKIKNHRENILAFPNILDNVIHFNSTRVIKKSVLNAVEFSQAEMEAREQMLELFYFLKNNIEGFENSQILMSGSQIGVRESRRIIGLYKLTAEDLMNCIKFEDSIVRGNYDIDIHSPDGSGTVLEHIPYNSYYTIPLRSTIPLYVDNLFVTGRPICSTHEAHSSIRIMPITTCIGEGVGCAAYLAVRNKVKNSQVNTVELHKLLDNNNALY